MSTPLLSYHYRVALINLEAFINKKLQTSYMWDNLKFWKKKQDMSLDLPQDLSLFSTPIDANQQDHTQDWNTIQSSPQWQPPEQTSFGEGMRSSPTQSTSMQSRDVELILAKIDALKSSVDHLVTRVEQIERGLNDKRRW